MHTPDTKVFAQLSQLLRGVVATEQEDAANHVSPHGQRLILRDKQPPLHTQGKEGVKGRGVCFVQQGRGCGALSPTADWTSAQAGCAQPQNTTRQGAQKSPKAQPPSVPAAVSPH